ncbi:hypothetical protein GALMADRAFT_114882 [Galerina marginata CBS 339.88]|uniref:Uncharacterized protein n=1 Tax=Galerina marginata (strain CBS 339.88) TaxID=685588 RepID=A0A067TI45_GALM3|nr:hypothetical protein GALMADRAFT_114882 [Galerina marginata CBS 339.88]
MFSKVWTTTALVLALSLQVNAHAAVAPVLGLSTDPQRSDVKRPNAKNPCGAGVDAASLIDSSTAVPVDETGSFKATVFNFNKGIDGSRKVKAAVDPTGTGASFTDMTVTTNGDLVSKDLGSQPIVAALPAGTTCTGGASGQGVLTSQFKNTIGFGNCMVVSQGDAATDRKAAAAGKKGAAGKLAGLKVRIFPTVTDQSH